MGIIGNAFRVVMEPGGTHLEHEMNGVRCTLDGSGRMENVIPCAPGTGYNLIMGPGYSRLEYHNPATNTRMQMGPGTSGEIQTIF